MDKYHRRGGTEDNPFVSYESDECGLTRCFCVMGGWTYSGMWQASRRAARDELHRAFKRHGMEVTFRSGRKAAR